MKYLNSKFYLLANQSQILSSLIEQPANFSIKDFQFNSNTMNVTLSWQKADFPVNGYQV
jgi:hypothetical protein